jgi:hypothetical protein
LDDVRFAASRRVLQRQQKPTGWRRTVAEVAATPGVCVDNIVAADREMSDVAEIIGKDSGAESGREGNAGIPACAFRGGGARAGDWCGERQQQGSRYQLNPSAIV